ncbi:hypothetical protein CTI12_AA192220 [Artemisia annua]|uniref:Uncharacterized protein n=1 Tax=Artemisia annua TaxID=35608 RepID=A0A2U1P549_ARTAN|nr:hypothetical protein CTI12_AA192220 [Artemisia annua]
MGLHARKTRFNIPKKLIYARGRAKLKDLKHVFQDLKEVFYILVVDLLCLFTAKGKTKQVQWWSNSCTKLISPMFMAGLLFRTHRVMHRLIRICFASTQVEYTDHSGHLHMAFAEAANEALLPDCRPTFNDAYTFLQKVIDRFQSMLKGRRRKYMTHLKPGALAHLRNNKASGSHKKKMAMSYHFYTNE